MDVFCFLSFVACYLYFFLYLLPVPFLLFSFPPPFFFIEALLGFLAGLSANNLLKVILHLFVLFFLCDRCLISFDIKVSKGSLV